MNAIACAHGTAFMLEFNRRLNVNQNAHDVLDSKGGGRAASDPYKG
jgi:hypothetical protein